MVHPTFPHREIIEVAVSPSLFPFPPGIGSQALGPPLLFPPQIEDKSTRPPQQDLLPSDELARHSGRSLGQLFLFELPPELAASAVPFQRADPPSPFTAAVRAPSLALS